MARHKNGWIKIHRSLVEDEIAEKGLSALGLWTMLLTLANHSESKIIWKGELRYLKRGEILTTLRELSLNNKSVTITSTRRMLDFFEKRQSIRQEISTKGRIITLLNYESYQKNIKESEVEMTNERQTDDKRMTNERHYNEEDKKRRSEEAPTKKFIHPGELQQVTYNHSDKVKIVKGLIDKLFNGNPSPDMVKAVPLMLFRSKMDVDHVREHLEDIMNMANSDKEKNPEWRAFIAVSIKKRFCLDTMEVI